MKIIINYSCVMKNDEKTVLEYDISKAVDSITKNYKIRFEFENEYASYICEEIADGIVVMLLPYAIRGGFDIESKVPVTEELFYRLQNQLIPQLTLCNNCKDIRIICEKTKPEWEPTAVATAMSCGVDSFTTLFEYTEDDLLDSHKITHLTFFQNGAHHSGHVGHSPDEGIVFENQLRRVKEYCEKYNKKLIVIKSNLDEILSDVFWNERYHFTHTYRNAGFVLLLQKLIYIYYYSPAYNADNFKCSFEQDSAMYERLILPNVSSKYTCFYNSNGSMTRIEKIKYISSFEETHNNLLVC